MNRRDVMKGMTAALVTALSPELLVGTATAGGLAGRKVEIDELPDLLAALDAQVVTLRARVIDPVVTRFYRGLGLRDSFPHDVAESMVRVAAFRDLPRRVQAHPEMQRRIRAELPRLGQQVLGLTRALRDLPERTRGQIRALLQANPTLPAALRERRRAILRAAGTPPERIDQTDRLMDRVFFRLQRQHPSMLIDELVDKVRRASDDAGAPEADWEALLATDLDADPLEPSDGLVLISDDPETDAGPPDGWTGDELDPTQEVPRSRGLRRAAQILLGVGLAVAGTGALMFLVGLLTIESSAGMALTVVGFLVILTGLTALGTALVLYLIAEARDSGDADGSLVLPEDTLAAIRGGDGWLTLAAAPA